MGFVIRSIFAAGLHIFFQVRQPESEKLPFRMVSFKIPSTVFQVDEPG
jgi:hypothetical protein